MPLACTERILDHFCDNGGAGMRHDRGSMISFRQQSRLDSMRPVKIDKLCRVARRASCADAPFGMRKTNWDLHHLPRIRIEEGVSGINE